MSAPTDLRDISRRWQAVWDGKKCFEVEIDHSKQKFLVTTPYPYISGSLHIGHGRVVIEMDVLARYLRMKGFNVCLPIAFHISGAPVLGISTAIEKKDPKKTQLYRDYVSHYIKDSAEVERIVQSFVDPWKIVEFFIPKMIDEYKQLGISADFRRSFTSGDVIHQKLVTWQFNKYHQKGYLKRAAYPVLYSLEYENAVAEDDIADGDTDPVEKQEFTLLRFATDEPSTFLVAATLRPETVYGQTNVWVNPDVTYVKIRVSSEDYGVNEQWIVSKECAQKLRHQRWHVEEISPIEARTLFGKFVSAPMIERKIPVLPSTFCDPDVGTGIVTCVPSDAPFDYIALQHVKSDEMIAKYNLDRHIVQSIEPISIIKTKEWGIFSAKTLCEQKKITSLSQKESLDEATKDLYKSSFHTGQMTDACGSYAGMSVKDAKDAIKQELIKNKSSFVFWETTRKAFDRSGGKVIVAILDNQWFLDFNSEGWKEKAKQELSSTQIVPEKYRKQFVDVFDWLDKRPCARKRGLGTKLPVDEQWVIESLSDSTLYMTLYTIQAYIKQNNIDAKQFTDAVFDYVFCVTDDVTGASHSGISTHHLENMRAEFSYWYPMDLRHSYQAHLPNHLSFMMFAHSGILHEQFWPKKLSFHGMVICEGSKMSKSKGNVITLNYVLEKYGPDVLRAYICHSAGVDQTINWEEQEVEKLFKHVSNLHATLLHIVNSRHDGDLPVQAKGFVSLVNSMVAKTEEAINSMDLRTYANIVFFDMLNAYKKVRRVLDEQSLYIVHKHIASTWVRMLAPLVPHIAEELYASLQEGLVSDSSYPIAKQEYVDETAEYVDSFVDQTLSDIRTIQQLAKQEKVSSVTLIVGQQWKYAVFSQVKQSLATTRDPKVILGSLMQSELKKYGQQIMKIVPSLLKDPSKIPSVMLSAEQEHTALVSFCAYMESQIGSPVRVKMADEFDHPKSSFASPGKPAIVLE